MIIDNHVHVFPDQAGPAGYKDEAAYRAELQKIVRPSWGRMYSSHEDPKYIAEAGEDVGFRVGRFNRFQWKKHGEDVWLQRGAVSMEKMEYTPRPAHRQHGLHRGRQGSRPRRVHGA